MNKGLLEEDNIDLEDYKIEQFLPEIKLRRSELEGKTSSLNSSLGHISVVSMPENEFQQTYELHKKDQSENKLSKDSFYVSRPSKKS